MNSVPSSPGGAPSGLIAVITASIIAASGFLGAWVNRLLTNKHERQVKEQDHEREDRKNNVEADVKARLNVYSASELLIEAYRKERDRLLERVDQQANQIDSLSQDKLQLMLRVNACEIKIANLASDWEDTKEELLRCRETSQELQTKCDELVKMFNGLSESIRQQFPSHPFLKILPLQLPNPADAEEPADDGAEGRSKE